MRHFKLTRLSDGYVTFACSEDTEDFPSGYDISEWEVVDYGIEPTDVDSATIALDDAGTEAWALEKIEEDAEVKTGTQVKRLRRHIGMVMLWQEVQLLKMSTDFSTLTTLQKAQRFPTLAALAQETGNSILTVATAVENRLWDRIRKMAVTQAKLLVARDAIRSAATKDDKIAAANVNLDEI